MRTSNQCIGLEVEKDEEIKKNEENINRLESELVELTATMEELSASIKELTEKSWLRGQALAMSFHPLSEA